MGLPAWYPRGCWENTRKAWVIYKLCECSPNISTGFPCRIFTEISPRSRRDSRQDFGHRDSEISAAKNPAEIQKSRRPKSCRDLEISAAKILPWFRNLGGQNPAEIQKSRRPKSCRGLEISATKILPRFRNLGAQNPAVIPKSRPPKSCRDLAEIQKSLGGQNPASRKDAIVF